MKTYIITLTYLDIPLLEYSLDRFYKTTELKDSEHILIDHLWPIDHWNHRRGILNLAEHYGCKVMTPYKNMGGHGGFNWTLQNLPLQEDDIIITYDGDSNPQTPGWDVAMRNLLSLDPSYAWVSLWIDTELNTKNWVRRPTRTCYHIVKPAQGIEMMNVTGWKYSFLKKVGLMKAAYQYYGQVESPMHQASEQLKLQWGYLRDYTEKPRPFDADARYQAWKAAHLSGAFKGNFDEYFKTL